MLTPTAAVPAIPEEGPDRPSRAVSAGDADLALVRSALAEDYDVLCELGRGGMAVVYKARERSLDRCVALKVLPFTLAHDDGLVERFQREARTAGQLEHPNIIPIFRVGRSGQVIFFAMKLLRGLSLADRLLEQRRLSPAETRRVLSETAAALGCAHAGGVVHRDVKPDNILLDEGGRCVVTDFGIARSASDSTLTAAGTSMGTPRYMSPEQARARPVDGRSDIYSLGVVGYHCLTGRLPFDGDDMMAILLAHVSTPVPVPRDLDAEGRTLYAVIDRMLTKDPERRFQTADEVIAALQSAAPSSATPQPGSLSGSIDAAAGSLVDGGAYAVRRTVAGAALQVTRARAFASQLSRRARMAVVGAALLATATPWAAQHALQNRSRCPADSTEFALLLDDVRPVSRGSEVKVSYDVCGLEKGVTVTERVSVARQGGGLRRGLQRLMRGTPAPVTGRFEETASGSGMRRHRSIALASGQTGTFSVTVAVTDARGRKREKSTIVQVSGDAPGP